MDACMQPAPWDAPTSPATAPRVLRNTFNKRGREEEGSEPPFEVPAKLALADTNVTEKPEKVRRPRHVIEPGRAIQAVADKRGIGQTWCNRMKAWQVRIYDATTRKKRYIGSYPDQNDAARAYDFVAVQMFGPTVRRNFPIEIITQAPVSLGEARKAAKTSAYIGVSWAAGREAWQVLMRHPQTKKVVHVGLYTVQEDAGRAYDRVAVELLGPNTPLNFPDEPLLTELPYSLGDRARERKSSRYVGVCWSKKEGGWTARLHDPLTRRQNYIGRYEMEEDAARAYDVAAVAARGPEAQLNFPSQPDVGEAIGAEAPGSWLAGRAPPSWLTERQGADAVAGVAPRGPQAQLNFPSQPEAVGVDAPRSLLVGMAPPSWLAERQGADAVAGVAARGPQLNFPSLPAVGAEAPGSWPGGMAPSSWVAAGQGADAVAGVAARGPQLNFPGLPAGVGEVVGAEHPPKYTTRALRQAWLGSTCLVSLKM
ncbi:hypothetical protein FOA52_010829 [Chlamydomonas sp. UWO 241]|nr:hypothetical protein FOA52_010829 [Chlamydomonas sp. UWO 241]